MEPTSADPLTIESRPYRRRITAEIDVELLGAIDAARGGLARSRYLEQVLEAAMLRERPHLPDDWTPEAHAERLYARQAARADALEANP